MTVTHQITQGSQGWHEFRAKHFGASEAAAMLGISPYKSRADLLREKATGITPEVDPHTQRIFDNGHATEAMARPIVEEQIGEELFPATMSDGKLSASCDGLTMLGDTAWEHKQWNQALADSVRRQVLPEAHVPQCQQVIMVTRAQRLIFTVSDGTRENMVSMEVLPDPEYQARIRAGWDQFERDLFEYTPEPVAVEVVATAQESLPAVYAQVSGDLAVQSNLDVFGQALKAFVERIPAAPETDQEFADTEAACKTLKEAEDRLSAAEDQALASLSDVEIMRRTVADLKNIARTTRLASEKLVKARKEAIRTEIVMTARGQFAAFVRALQNETRRVRLTGPAFAMPDFGNAIKGLKTLASIRDRTDTTLANAKIEAGEAATDIRAKLAKFSELVAAEHEGLFRDLDDLITMAPNHFETAVTSRVEEHKRLEAERIAKIEQEAKEKAEAAAQAKIEAEQAKPAEQPAQAAPELQRYPAAVNDLVGLGQTSVAPQPAPQADEPATLTLGDMNALLAPISLSAAVLAELGVQHSATRKTAKLYRESDFHRACEAIIAHINEIQALETI